MAARSERLAEVDTAVFDKTGTLTLGDAAACSTAVRSTPTRWRWLPRSHRIPAIPIRSRCAPQAGHAPWHRSRRIGVSEHPGSGLEAFDRREPCIGSADPNGRLAGGESMQCRIGDGKRRPVEGWPMP